MYATLRRREKDKKYALITIVQAPASWMRIFLFCKNRSNSAPSEHKAQRSRKIRPNHILKNVKVNRSPLPQVPLFIQVRNVNIPGTGAGYFLKVNYWR